VKGERLFRARTRDATHMRSRVGYRNQGTTKHPVVVSTRFGVIRLRSHWVPGLSCVGPYVAVLGEIPNSIVIVAISSWRSHPALGESTPSSHRRRRTRDSRRSCCTCRSSRRGSLPCRSRPSFEE